MLVTILRFDMMASFGFNMGIAILRLDKMMAIFRPHIVAILRTYVVAILIFGDVGITIVYMQISENLMHFD